MVPDLLSQNWIRYGFYEVVDGINGRVDTLKSLNLLSYGHGVVPIGLDLSEWTIDAHSHQSGFIRRKMFLNVVKHREHVLQTHKLVSGFTE